MSLQTFYKVKAEILTELNDELAKYQSAHVELHGRKDKTVNAFQNKIKLVLDKLATKYKFALLAEEKDEQ